MEKEELEIILEELKNTMSENDLNWYFDSAISIFNAETSYSEKENTFKLVKILTIVLTLLRIDSNSSISSQIERINKNITGEISELSIIDLDEREINIREIYPNYSNIIENISLFINELREGKWE